MISLDQAKMLFGRNFIGPEELSKVAEKLTIDSIAASPEIPFEKAKLESLKEDYILILGVSKSKDGSPLTLNQMRDFLGMDPQIKEPCFYNQDWYIKEDFADKTILEDKWYLISKTVVEETRGKRPDELESMVSGDESFPSAILTAFTFFAYYFLNDEKLWVHDFIWCKDLDHNGDIIYTGRYEDPTGVNKNGFNVHRHLKIRPIYGLAPQLSLE